MGKLPGANTIGMQLPPLVLKRSKQCCESPERAELNEVGPLTSS